MELWDEVRRSCATHGTLRPGEAVLVGVSGGVDSVVLLDVLVQLGHPCRVIHVDHGLRAAESRGDAEFVEALCARLRVPCQVLRVDVAAEQAAHGGSVQMAARSLRRALFVEEAGKQQLRVALAHHGDDAVETLFVNLLRGAGSKGWAGMVPVSLPIVRPLLACTRGAILAYAEARGLSWREDASNASPKYLRNRIRHELIPLLEDLRPGASANILRALDLFREQEQLAEQARAEVLRSAQEHGFLSREVLQQQAAPLGLLQAWLGPLGFHPDRQRRMWRALQDGHTGALVRVKDLELHVERNGLRLLPVQAPAERWQADTGLDWPADAPLRVELLPAAAFDPTAGPYVIWLDPVALHDLELRPWEAGDRLAPWGMEGSRKVSDILIDAKVPRARKAEVYLLTVDAVPVWVVGLRAGRQHAFSGQGASVLRVEWTGSVL